MPKDTQPGKSTSSDKMAFAAALAVCALVVLSLLKVTVLLNTELFDGFHYLNNARYLAGHDMQGFWTGYLSIRPPLIPLLQAPAMFFYAPGGNASLLAPHLLSLVYSILVLVALYFFLKGAIGRGAAAFGLIVFAINPLFIRYAPFVMTDLPLVGLGAMAMHFHLKAIRAGRTADYALSALFLFLMFVTKFTTLLAVGIVFVVEILVLLKCRKETNGQERRSLISIFHPRWWAGLALAAGAWFLMLVLLQGWVDGGFSGETVTTVIETLKRSAFHGRVVLSDAQQSAAIAEAAATEPVYEYIVGLWKIFTPTLFILALYGITLAFRQRKNADILSLAWFFGFGVALTFVISHKEIRYLTPLIPALIYFISRGADKIARRIRSEFGDGNQRTVQMAIFVGAAALLVIPAGAGIQVLEKYKDPMFEKPVLQEAAAHITRRMPPTAPVMWMNNLFSFYPEDPVYLPNDETFYFHHIGPEAMEYLLDHPMIPVDIRLPANMDTPPDWVFIQLFPTEGAMVLSSKTVLNSRNFYDLAPEYPEPFRLVFVQRKTFNPEPIKGQDEPITYISNRDDGQKLIFEKSGEGWAVKNDPEVSGQYYFRTTPNDIPKKLELPLDVPPSAVEWINIEKVEIPIR